MDLLLYFAGALLLFCGAAVGGFVFQLLATSALVARVYALENSIKGARGRETQANSTGRIAQAMGRFIELQKEQKPMPEILKQLAAEFPDVALDLGQKALKGKLGGGLGGLI